MIDKIAGILNGVGNAGSVLLIPPSYAPELIKRALSLKLGNLKNVRVLSLRSFVAEAIIPVEPELRLISSRERLRLFSLIVKEKKDSLKYFAEVAEFPGFIRHLSKTTEELQLNRVERAHCPKGPKWDEMFALLDEYLKQLKQNKQIDYPSALQRLTSNAQPEGKLLFVPQHFSALESEFVSKSGFEEITPEKRGKKPNLSAYKVDTPHQEVLQTIRNIRDKFSSEEKPGITGILVDDYETYYSLFSSVLNSADAGSLIYYAKGTPLFATSAGKLLSYYIDWMENRFSLYRWKKIVESPLFNKDILLKDGATVSDYHAAIKLITDAKLVLFDGSFCSAIEQHLDGKVSRDEDSDEALPKDDKTTGRVAIAKALIGIFEPVAKADDPVDKLKGVAAIFGKYTKKTRGGSAAKVQTVMDEILSVPGVLSDLSIEEIALRLKEEVRGRFINYEQFAFDRPIMGTIDDLALIEFDTLFVTGMSEKGLPKKVNENPLLLDGEKREIETEGKKFYSVAEVSKQNDNEFMQMLQSAGEVIMSAPLRDMESGKDRLVSRYMLEAFKMFNSETYDYNSMNKHLIKQGSSGNNYLPATASDAFNEYELAATLLVSGNAKDEDLGKDFPYMKLIRDFMNNRRFADTFNEYSGVLELGEERELKPLSASRIGNWLKCPYQYYLQNELGLKRDEDFTAKELNWLDALQFGSFVHDVFFRFMTRLKNGDGTVRQVTEDDRGSLNTVFNEVTVDYEAKFPVTSEIHKLKQLAELEWIRDSFFELEKENGHERLYFELAAGMPDPDRRDDNSAKKPVEIDLGDGIKFFTRGSVDRVDGADNDLILYDYKTGRPQKSTKNDPFGGGELTQAGLYPLMVEKVLGHTGNSLFRYYYTSRKGGFGKTDIPFDKTNRELFEHFMKGLIGEIKRGNFVPNPSFNNYEKKYCPYCDYREECVEINLNRLNRWKNADINHDLFDKVKSSVKIKKGGK